MVTFDLLKIFNFWNLIIAPNCTFFGSKCVKKPFKAFYWVSLIVLILISTFTYNYVKFVYGFFTIDYLILNLKTFFKFWFNWSKKIANPTFYPPDTLILLLKIFFLIFYSNCSSRPNRWVSRRCRNFEDTNQNRLLSIVC